jgi:hypothetical protein
MTWRDAMNEVPWATFRGAYGGASTVPAELEALAAGRDEGSVSFIHQGDMYEVTPHVVPFFVSIAEDTTLEVRARVEVLRLLAFMVECEPPSLVGERYNPFTKQAEPASGSRFVELAKWIRATHAALVKERTRFETLAKATPAELSRAARAVLSALDEMAMNR